MAQVLVQPSNRRAYPMAAYANVGAKIQEDISEASCIFGVKQVTEMFVCIIATPCTWSQVPIDALLSNKTFCFFSHTIKAQPDNMDLLDAMLEKNVRSYYLSIFIQFLT